MIVQPHIITIKATSVLAGCISFVGCFGLFTALPVLQASAASLVFLGLLWMIFSRTDEPRAVMADEIPIGTPMTEEEIEAEAPAIAARLPTGYKIAAIQHSGLSARTPGSPIVPFSFVLLFNPELPRAVGGCGATDDEAMSDALKRIEAQ